MSNALVASTPMDQEPMMTLGKLSITQNFSHQHYHHDPIMERIRRRWLSETKLCSTINPRMGDRQPDLGWGPNSSSLLVVIGFGAGTE